MKTIKTIFVALVLLVGASAFAQTAQGIKAKAEKEISGFTQDNLMEYATVKFKLSDFIKDYEKQKRQKIASLGLSLEDYQKIEDAGNPQVQTEGISKENQMKKYQADKVLQELNLEMDKAVEDAAQGTKIGLNGYKEIEEAATKDKRLSNYIDKLIEQFKR